MELKTISGGVTAPSGFLASGVHCGIRKNKSKRDLALIFSKTPCTAAAVYTQNLVIGAPNVVTKRNLADGKAQAVVCNSGNANTCNADGEQKAAAMCELIAKRLHIAPSDVIVASTGVIGQVLPLEPIENGADALVAALSEEGSPMAAEAIMTTDLIRKEIAVEFSLGGKTVRIGGIAKGSGMIHPNMATMLGFLTSDAAISAEMIQKALSKAVKVTFNMVSVDGDTSTNDMVTLMASGTAGNPLIDGEGPDFDAFCEALTFVCRHLSRELARDGEGATKLLVCKVSGADSLRGRPEGQQVGDLFQPAQGRHVRPGRQLGQGVVRPWLRRRQSGHFQNSGFLCFPGGPGGCMPWRRRDRLQRRGSQKGAFGKRNPH